MELYVDKSQLKYETIVPLALFKFHMDSFFFFAEQ